MCREEPALSPIRAVLLDANGTLFREARPRAAIYAAAARRHGHAPDEPALAEALRAAHAELPRRIGGAFRYTRPWFDRFVAEVFARVGIVASEPLREELLDTYTRPETFRVDPDVRPALAAIRARVPALGIVSNWAPTLRALLDALELGVAFDFVLASAEQEHEKPERELFERALAAAGVAAHEALHVGDHPVNDVAGARGAGIAALLLRRDGAPPLGAGEVASLLEVGARLDARAGAAR